MKKLPIHATDKSNLKRYYSIGEVAEMFEVTKSLIRFWEGEFDWLRPHKNSKGERRFTLENIEQLHLIYQLVKERGFTIDGARSEIVRIQVFQREKEAVLNQLEKTRDGLIHLRKALFPGETP